MLLSSRPAGLVIAVRFSRPSDLVDSVLVGALRLSRPSDLVIAVRFSPEVDGFLL